MRALGLGSLFLLLASQAQATALTPVAQDRRVSSTLTVEQAAWLPTSNPVFPDFDPPDFTSSIPNGPQQVTASDFLPFSASVSVPDSGSVFGLAAQADAAQSSEILGARLAASGSWEATLDGLVGTLGPPVPYDFGIESTTTSGESHYEVDFTLSEDTSYTLRGTLAFADLFASWPFAFIEGSALLRLEETGGAVIHAFAVDCTSPPVCTSSPVVVDEEGTLPAGSYTLVASASGSGGSACLDVGGGFTCFNPDGGGAYDIELAFAPQVPAVGILGMAQLVVVILMTAAWAVRGRSVLRSR